MKNILKIIFVIIGTIIGAGFASGKEIYLFFGMYGQNGIIGIIISQILIGAIIYKVLKISKKEELTTYEELTNKTIKNKKINEIIKIIINIFLLMTFYVMIAGFSAYFSQELGIPNIIGTIIIGILCYIIFMGNIDRLIQVNSILIPALIIFIIILATKNLDAFSNINEKMIQDNFPKSIWSAILYSSYNSITLIPIIVSLKKYIQNKKQITIVSILCTVILITLAIAIFGLILKVDININQIELPTVYVAGMVGKIYKYLYGLIILVAIFTSAISAGYTILENYTAKPKNYKKIALLLCLSSVLVSKIGFSNLINTLYPMFGLLGIMQIYFVFVKK